MSCLFSAKRRGESNLFCGCLKVARAASVSPGQQSTRMGYNLVMSMGMGEIVICT